MRRFRHSTTSETASSVDISPLIDVVFLLLIFFIVTTVFVKETGVEISKPRAASSQDLDKRSILLAVTSEGRVWHGGREIGNDGVRADASATTDATVRVIDAAKLAGAVSVSLATER
jgi:biopolymer transport protein ExbD